MRPISVVFLFVLSCLGLACSFENRSGAYECPLGNECESPRSCVQGWCVLSSNLSDAATGGEADAFECPSECDRCSLGRCILDCDDFNTCAGSVVCPKGVPCEVNCDGDNSCAAGVDCSQSSDCEVNCDGDGSCAGPIECGSGPCDLDCRGAFSCAGGLDCSDSCQCDSSCPGGVCNNHVCPGNSPCSTSSGCTDGPGACRNCN